MKKTNIVAHGKYCKCEFQMKDTSVVDNRDNIIVSSKPINLKGLSISING